MGARALPGLDRARRHRYRARRLDLGRCVYHDADDRQLAIGLRPALECGRARAVVHASPLALCRGGGLATDGRALLLVARAARSRRSPSTGVVELPSRSQRPRRSASDYTNTSPPVVCRDLVIVGNDVGDRLIYPNDPPATCARSTRGPASWSWTFHPMPGAASPAPTRGATSRGRRRAAPTSGADSLDERARAASTCSSARRATTSTAARGLGHELFGESIVCLDAATGVRKWHFQIVHHGLWDYEFPVAAHGVSIRSGGRRLTPSCSSRSRDSSSSSIA